MGAAFSCSEDRGSLGNISYTESSDRRYSVCPEHMPSRLAVDELGTRWPQVFWMSLVRDTCVLRIDPALEHLRETS